MPENKIKTRDELVTLVHQKVNGREGVLLWNLANWGVLPLGCPDVTMPHSRFDGGYVFYHGAVPMYGQHELLGCFGQKDNETCAKCPIARGIQDPLL